MLRRRSSDRLTSSSPKQKSPLSSAYQSLESEVGDSSEVEQRTCADVYSPSDAGAVSSVPLTVLEPPAVSPSLQSWENRIWQNSLVQTVQKRVKKVFVNEGSPPVAARTRTSLKRSSSSANISSDGADAEKYMGEGDRMTVSLRKALVKRKDELGPYPKRRPVERED
jgi:hypothetical protein